MTACTLCIMPGPTPLLDHASRSQATSCNECCACCAAGAGRPASPEVIDLLSSESSKSSESSESSESSDDEWPGDGHLHVISAAGIHSASSPSLVF